MKKLTLIFAFLLTASTMLQAKHFNSELNLRLYDNAYFTVILDNMGYNQPSNNYVFKDLKPGKHYLKVIRKQYNPYGCGTFDKLIYKGWINVPAGTKFFAEINSFQQFAIVNSYANYNNFYNNNNTTYNYPNDEYTPCVSTPSYNFEGLKNTIENQSFEQSKLKIAKQAISSNSLSSSQVRELMMLFDFESSKLELAKFAYHYTNDKQNYFMVNDAFSFSSSISSLDDYISGTRY